MKSIQFSHFSKVAGNPDTCVKSLNSLLKLKNNSLNKYVAISQGFEELVYQ